MKTLDKQVQGLKTFKKMGFRVMLLSDNRAVKPIEIRDDNSLRVIGIVREIMRDPENFE